MESWSDKKYEQEEDKELSYLMETFSSIQEALSQLNSAVPDYKDDGQGVSRLCQMNKLLETQLSLLDRIGKII